MELAGLRLFCDNVMQLGSTCRAKLHVIHKRITQAERRSSGYLCGKPFLTEQSGFIFSGHGIQQSCAAGDQLADLILNGSDPSVRRHALHDFSFNRIIDNRPFLEQNII